MNRLLQNRESIILYSLKWLIICLVLGILSGSASAVFLLLLHWVTIFREENFWLIALLPLGGLIVGCLYNYYGKGIEKGNNLLIETVQSPAGAIPLKMAPLVLLGTLITHFFGGSAGREGTAVQMSGAMADQLTTWFKLKESERKLLIIAGISAGFSSVFGTPLAGTLFGLEVIITGVLMYQAVIPAFATALIAHFVTSCLWEVPHSHYEISLLPEINFLNFGYALCAGICFGFCARFFSWFSHFTILKFRIISNPVFRSFIGGAILAVIFLIINALSDNTKYIGLGLPVIISSFKEPLPAFDFLLKLILTSVTLGCGFKGGEVTPLFFMGATLGSSLSVILPLPTSLLAGMGFVAVFGAAANTPVTCVVLAMEMFGTSCGVYAAIACFTAFICSGHTGIYTSQVIGIVKYPGLKKEEGQRISSLQKSGTINN